MRHLQPGSTISLPSLLLRQTIGRRTRQAFGKDRDYQIAGHDVRLPPGHLLPEFQRFAPSYDVYAGALLAEIAADEAVRVIDIGGNVGDTAVLALAASPNIKVTSVEGSAFFLPYLRANVAPFGGRVSVVDKFVGEPGERIAYTHNGSTGGFAASNSEGREDFVAPEALLDEQPIRTVWKTDTDGYDIPLLIDHWEAIRACEVVWFEFDVEMTDGGLAAAARLAGLLSEDGRHILVFDNFGRFMFSTSDASALTGLASWQVRLSGSLVPSVRYFDVWACQEKGLADRLTGIALRPS